MAEQQGTKSIDVMQKAGQWKEKYYSTDPPNIRPEIRELFEKYSKIPASEVDAHLEVIRNKAWSIHPYPCIGQWRFLDLAIGNHSAYPEILERMGKGHQIFLDLGCAFAQDIRKLVYDGIDSKNCWGSDIQSSFIDLGYELFRDKATLRSRFIEADIFDPESKLREVEGQVDIIGASSFFHLFDWVEQKKVGHQTAKLLKPQAGSIIVGRQVGCSSPGETSKRNGTGRRYRHDLDSWRRMWKEIGDEAGMKFQVDGSHKPVPAELEALTEAGDLILQFTVRRV